MEKGQVGFSAKVRMPGSTLRRPSRSDARPLENYGLVMGVQRNGRCPVHIRPFLPHVKHLDYTSDRR